MDKNAAAYATCVILGLATLAGGFVGLIALIFTYQYVGLPAVIAICVGGLWLDIYNETKNQNRCP